MQMKSKEPFLYEGRNITPDMDRLFVEITTNTYILKKEVRSCALVDLPEDLSLEQMLTIRDFLEWDCGDELKFAIYQGTGDIFLYTFDYELSLYELTREMDYTPGIANNPQAYVLKEFLKGKLLGYSSRSIYEWLKRSK